MISSKTKIGLLLAAHIAAGLVLAWVTYNGSYMATVGLFALIPAQTGLLGIWGATSTNRLYWRLSGVCASIAYLYVLAITAQKNWPLWSTIWVDYMLMIALSPAVIFLVLSGLRYGRGKLRLARSDVLSQPAARIQFTIRHILMTTAFVAVLLAIGRGVRTYTDWWANPSLVYVAIPIIVELATLWAALGVRRPALRLAVVVPTAFLFGAISIYYQGFGFSPDWTVRIGQSAVFGLQSIITAASLLVVRSCGWRLVRGKVAGSSNRQEIEPMAYSESLADRIRRAFGRRRGIEERKMFGDVGFLLHGNMVVGVWKNSLLVRLGPDQTEAALKEEHVSEFVMKGRASKGWVLVAPGGIEHDDQLNHWIQRAEEFVVTLPAK